MFQLAAFIEAHFRLDRVHCAPKAYDGREGHGDISKSRRSVLNAGDRQNSTLIAKNAPQ
jgi:hypothetical protein